MTIARREFLAGLAAAGGATLLGDVGASAQQRPRRYAKPVIDLHFHWYPKEFIDLLEKEGAANGAIIGHDKNGNVTVKTPTSVGGGGGEGGGEGGGSPFSDKGKTDVNVMLKQMDDREVDMEVVTQTNPHIIWAPPEFGAKLARAINDGNSRLYQQYPKRFMGSISLPMQDVKLSLEELERAAKMPGMRAINVTENVRDKNLGDDEFWPIYARCEQLGLPLFLKNVDTVHERLIEKDYSMMNIISNPFEATIAATSLMLSGMLDEFPKLDVYLPHAGGFFAFAIPRIAYAKDHMNAANFKHVKQPVTSYLHRFHYDLILHSPKLTRTLIDMVGADRVACGTDFPQAMAIQNPLDYVEAIPGITKREADMILCENPARLLKL